MFTDIKCHLTWESEYAQILAHYITKRHQVLSELDKMWTCIRPDIWINFFSLITCSKRCPKNILQHRFLQNVKQTFHIDGVLTTLITDSASVCLTCATTSNKNKQDAARQGITGQTFTVTTQTPSQTLIYSQTNYDHKFLAITEHIQSLLKRQDVTGYDAVLCRKMVLSTCYGNSVSLCLHITFVNCGETPKHFQFITN